MSKYFLKPELYGLRENDEISFGQLALTPLLVQQLSRLYPAMSADEVRNLAEARTAEFLKTTPRIATWQDFHWPVIDGDYARYVMTAGQADLNGLAEDGDGKALLKASLQDTEADIDTIWESLKREPLVQDGKVDQNWPALAHVFESVETGKKVIIWDVM